MPHHVVAEATLILEAYLGEQSLHPVEVIGPQKTWGLTVPQEIPAGLKRNWKDAWESVAPMETISGYEINSRTLNVNSAHC